MIRVKQYNNKAELEAVGEEDAMMELPVGLLSKYADASERFW